MDCHFARKDKFAGEARERGEWERHASIKWRNMPFIDERIKSEVSCIFWFVSVDMTDVCDSRTTTNCKTHPGHLPPSSRVDDEPIDSFNLLSII
jgi:hypothetical protein